MAVEATIRIELNGAARDVAAGTSLADLVRALGLAPEAVATEVNQRLVPRRAREERRLEAGDRIEIVTLVGGG